MTPQQEDEFRTNVNLIILGYKLKALKDSLSGEQLVIYNQSIEDTKQLVKTSLEASLSPEQVALILEGLDK
ncbi:hypothetical protein [Chryseobacterium sp. 22458]|uniref:hypothetical protein n=1 Tax=Chryseobacterium sp. 22458 TaxID=3453921 RepID=UPI003F82BD40